MSTPTDLSTFRVTWVTGSGERATLRTQDVLADEFEVHERSTFVVFRAGLTKAAVFSIRTEFVVSIERLSPSTGTDEG